MSGAARGTLFAFPVEKEGWGEGPQPGRGIGARPTSRSQFGEEIRIMSTRFRTLGGVALLVALLLVLTMPQIAAAANTIVTPANPDGWAITDQRDDATVSITADNPRSGLGSLKFTTNTVTSGQDKVDFTKTWAVPGRTLAALSDVCLLYTSDAADE